MRFETEEHNSQEGPVCFDLQEGKWQDGEVRLAPEGCNSHDDQVCFAPVQLLLEGGNSQDDQVRFAPKGGKLVERFGKLDLGLVQ